MGSGSRRHQTSSRTISPIDLTNSMRPSRSKGKGAKDNGNAVAHQAEQDAYQSPQLSTQSSPRQQPPQEHPNVYQSLQVPYTQQVTPQPSLYFDQQHQPLFQQSPPYQERLSQNQEHYMHQPELYQAQSHFEPPPPPQPPSYQQQQTQPQLQQQSQIEPQQQPPSECCQSQHPVSNGPQIYITSQPNLSQEPQVFYPQGLPACIPETLPLLSTEPQPMIHDIQPCHSIDPSQVLSTPTPEVSECQRPLCQQLRLRIQLLELQIQHKCIQDLHNQQPPLYSTHIAPPQSHHGPAGDSNSVDEEGSEDLKLGIQQEIQEHVMQMQFQSNMTVHMHAPVPVAPVPVAAVPAALPSQMVMTIPTPAFTPAPTQMPIHVASQVPPEVPAPVVVEPSFSASPPILPPGPLQLAPQVPSQDQQASPQVPLQGPPPSSMQAPVQVPTQVPTPTVTPIPPQNLLQMHVQIPEVSPKDMPIPCCLPNCKVNHNAWLNAPIVEDSEIDSFGFTDVLFDKYDDIFRRLWLVDRELKVYGQFKAPIVPKFRRRPRERRKEPSAELTKGPSLPESPKDPLEAATCLPKTSPTVPVSQLDDEDILSPLTCKEQLRAARVVKERYESLVHIGTSAIFAKTAAAETGQTEKDVCDNSRQSLKAFSYRLFILESHRRKAWAAFNKRLKLEEELESVEKELECAKKQGLMPWAK